ncbi:hypothetical protein C8Q77DRAFT_208307 [Trametes polyzona]|nr:hypothetical protein C8Q77DRAFT_208307 [Trametes polyzona]
MKSCNCELCHISPFCGRIINFATPMAPSLRSDRPALCGGAIRETVLAYRAHSYTPRQCALPRLPHERTFPTRHATRFVLPLAFPNPLYRHIRPLCRNDSEFVDAHHIRNRCQRTAAVPFPTRIHTADTDVIDERTSSVPSLGRQGATNTARRSTVKSASGVTLSTSVFRLPPSCSRYRSCLRAPARSLPLRLRPMSALFVPSLFTSLSSGLLAFAWLRGARRAAARARRPVGANMPLSVRPSSLTPRCPPR